MQIPKTHKAVVYDQPGKISTSLLEIETPAPGHGQVLIKMTHSGICHSDLSLMAKTLTVQWSWLPEPVKAGQIGGHEGVGVVAQLGPSSETSGVKVGDRVGIKWIASACGSCMPCLAGADGVCENAVVSGYTCPGTFQQYTLAPAHYVTPIPDGLASEVAAPLLCGGLTVYSALKKCRAHAGDWVVIAGAGGGLGHLGVQLGGRGMGFRIIGLDIGSKEEFVKDCGAEAFVDISEYPTSDGKTAADRILEITGNLGAAASIVCSGSNAAYDEALSYLRFNGTLVCVGVPYEAKAIASAFPHALVSKQLAIVGSTVGNRREAIETLAMAKRVATTPFQVEKVENINTVFNEMKAGKLQGRVVLDLQSF
ncbi:Polyketide synthase, enoylreductase [Penicillium expansum]|uniref:Polyketide synthase, enoylreductase n=1 Tax=Penicillium expansum TaxID=27334 RepID=A0A0A2K2Y7_PENEN|nr:Polyketide synthase, enoylreductase [Penicillium expansum]KGO44420.1 Polyketide synthase, enoylreductase [Penicillium expansum]KGO62049.1 Polyketide synthase, enoylreductase [Penicillium expansum]KGO71034.1 Polyketide synthase, enoylreductase [Penicillium expansum]